MAERARLEQQVLLGVFAMVILWSAVGPYDLPDYLLELATPLGGAVLLLVTARWYRFTPVAYRLMFLEGVILLVGAHYTHERVPVFEWLRGPMGWTRNHYDRFAHFAAGFLLAVPFRELIVRSAGARGRAASVLAVISVMALACFYEITEWWIAASASPGVGAAYLGSQGDIWDAQKDMLLDTLGGIASVALLTGVHDRQMGRTSTGPITDRSPQGPPEVRRRP
jgi:putative membrane protein